MGNNTFVNHQLVHHILNHYHMNVSCVWAITLPRALLFWRWEELCNESKSRNTWLFGGESLVYVEEFSLHVSMTLQPKQNNNNNNKRNNFIPSNKQLVLFTGTGGPRMHPHSVWHSGPRWKTGCRRAARLLAVTGLSAHCITSGPGWRRTRQW